MQDQKKIYFRCKSTKKNILGAVPISKVQIGKKWILVDVPNSPELAMSGHFLSKSLEVPRESVQSKA